MLEKLFILKEHRIEALSENFYVIPEFAELAKTTYLTEKGNLQGRKKVQNGFPKHIRIAKYMYLAISFMSPYSDLPDDRRHELAIKEADIDWDYKKDEKFQNAINKAKEIENSNISVRMLAACKTNLNKMIEHIETVNYNETVNDRPKYDINKYKDFIATFSALEEGLNKLEERVKANISSKVEARGKAKVGYYEDRDFDIELNDENK